MSLHHKECSKLKSNKTGNLEGTPSVSSKIPLGKYGLTLFMRLMNLLFLLKGDWN